MSECTASPTSLHYLPNFSLIKTTTMSHSHLSFPVVESRPSWRKVHDYPYELDKPTANGGGIHDESQETDYIN